MLICLHFSDVLYAFTYRPAFSDGAYFSTYNPRKPLKGKSSGSVVTPHDSPILVPHQTVKDLLDNLYPVKDALLDDR